MVDACTQVWQSTTTSQNASVSEKQGVQAPSIEPNSNYAPGSSSQSTQTDTDPESSAPIADPYASAKGSVVPYGAISTPVGYHLLPATKDKIWKGAFVDIFSLLFREEEARDKEKDRRGSRKRVKRGKPKEPGPIGWQVTSYSWG